MIAEMGSTDTDRPKLHFELRVKGQPVDPTSLLRAASRTPVPAVRNTPAPALSEEASPTVRNIQRDLTALGYRPGPIDGLIGQSTIEAIRKFQSDAGITPDGVASTTLAALLAMIVKDALTQPTMTTQAKLTSTGSGFFVNSEGYALTNQHVIESCESIRILTPSGSYKAKVIAANKEDDLAVLHASLRPDAVVLFRRTGAALGEDVVVSGFPLRGLLSGMNLTTGTVSSTSGLRGDARYLQITAPVQPGNSGGPLLDAKGSAIGVIVGKLDAVSVARTTGDMPQNVNFAIKGAVAKSFLSIHDIPFTEATSETIKERTVIANEAKNYTALVECWK